jgi:glutamate-1-semialdehyde 2,1-aminomutase
MDTVVPISDAGLKSNAYTQFTRSNELLARAQELIPLGTQTFSKAANNFVQGVTPLFLDRGTGAHVWDVDGNKYVDYILGLMPNILGYCDPDVDEAVIDQVRKGATFSFATDLELALAERLVRLIPGADMVRFGKNGSDATTAAVRVARAATGRDKVIVCGYHGWHDWYIGTTARDGGVPDAVKNLSFETVFNDASHLEGLIAADPTGFAAVILEPTGKTPADPDYLRAVRNITARHGIILIFDEIVTGFRVHMGGAQAYYNVVPDLSCFGKAMANGLPISALVGRRDLMKQLEDIFVSGTFGGEALSLAASIATIDKLENLEVPERLWRHGDILLKKANAIFADHGLADVIRFEGEGWWPRLAIGKIDVDPVLVTSLIRQELVGAGLLIGGGLNLCLDHMRDDVVRETCDAMTAAAGALQVSLNAPDPEAYLRGERIRPTFSVR